MIIQYFGEGCFRLQSGELSLLVDSQNARLKADVYLKTLSLAEAPPEAGVISFPGEYEIKGIDIQGWPIPAESTEKILKAVYAVNWEEMRFVFLGHLSGPLDPKLLDELGETDVVFVPTGDAHFISAGDAVKLVKQLSPKIILPASFKKNGQEFAKTMGLPGEETDKLVFRRKELAEGKSRLGILKPNGDGPR